MRLIFVAKYLYEYFQNFPALLYLTFIFISQLMYLLVAFMHLGDVLESFWKLSCPFLLALLSLSCGWPVVLKLCLLIFFLFPFSFHKILLVLICVLYSSAPQPPGACGCFDIHLCCKSSNLFLTISEMQLNYRK